ncbi:hypothetical protein WJX84_011747 [Apatococcus fuscideae]|uniref:Uncharacterized protein n=1 Tax=Apatococcus fuscideae TaxID=2026836 RepID=A0AAW1T6U3_9CHLO
MASGRRTCQHKVHALLVLTTALLLRATEAVGDSSLDRSLIDTSVVHVLDGAGPAPAPVAASNTNAVTATIVVAGPSVWPFTRSKASDFIQALSDALSPRVPVFAGCPDVIITGAVQATAAASKRRLLGDSSAAAVDVIVNGHGSSELASEMASNLTTAIQTGTFMTKLNSLADGYSIDSTAISSGPTTGATTASFGCTHGTVAGMCAEPSSTVDTVQLPGTNKHVKVWAIVVGAVVGAILVFAIIGGLIWCCWSRAAARRDAAAGKLPAVPPKPMTPTGPIPFYHDRAKAEAGDAVLKANASNAKSLNLTASGVPGSMGIGQRLNSKLGSMHLSNASDPKAPVKFAPTRGSGFIETPETP